MQKNMFVHAPNAVSGMMAEDRPRLAPSCCSKLLASALCLRMILDGPSGS